MSLTFQPALYKDSRLYELPQPVLSLRIQDAWDFARFKVPLVPGDIHTGHSLGGVTIAVEGLIVAREGPPRAREAAMFAALETLRAVLDVGSSEEKYDFYVYHDAVLQTYRHFRACSTVRFDYDVTDKNRFRYAILIHADDPHIYTTGPDD